MLCKVEGARTTGSKSVLEKGPSKNGLKTNETDFLVDENERKEEMLYNSTLVAVATAVDDTNMTTEAGGGDVSNKLELHV